MNKLFCDNVIKAMYHALRIDEDGPLIFRDEHYDRMIRDIEGEDEIAEALNESANGYSE